MGQIMKELINFVKEFLFYPEDNRESLKSFRQSFRSVLDFRNIAKATKGKLENGKLLEREDNGLN